MADFGSFSLQHTSLRTQDVLSSPTCSVVVCNSNKKQPRPAAYLMIVRRNVSACMFVAFPTSFGQRRLFQLFKCIQRCRHLGM